MAIVDESSSSASPNLLLRRRNVQEGVHGETMGSPMLS
jgi:hypothetical protein